MDLADAKKEISNLKVTLKDVTAQNDMDQWLMSVPLDTTTSMIQLSLSYTPEQTVELDVFEWTREIDMWIDLLENLPYNINFDPPASIKLQDVKNCARNVITEMLKYEILIIIRSVPGATESTAFSESLMMVAILISTFSTALSLFKSKSSNSMTRFSVVLEGDNIGGKLVAGDVVFPIAPLALTS